MEATPQEVLICQTAEGKEPFSTWLDMQTPKVQAIVMNRLDRVENGNFGDHWPVGEGVCELRVDFGPGYRIYYGRIGNEVHLISAGEKSSQPGDIKAAIAFWREHE